MLFSEYILLDKEACLLAIKRRDKCINAEFLKGIPGNAAEWLKELQATGANFLWTQQT